MWSGKLSVWALRYFSPMGWACTPLSGCESEFLSARRLFDIHNRSRCIVILSGRQAIASVGKEKKFNVKSFQKSLFSVQKFLTLSIIQHVWTIRKTFITFNTCLLCFPSRLSPLNNLAQPARIVMSFEAEYLLILNVMKGLRFLDRNLQDCQYNKLNKLSSPINSTKFVITLQEIWSPSSSYMVLQPISGLGLLFMRFRNLTLIDGW
jgi:hypothetical protein